MAEFQIIEGDALEKLSGMESGSVHCVVTSPPYFGLRDYGISGQLGLESSPEGFVSALVGVFREVRRVLRDDGTLWLNLGDSYAGGGTIGRNDTTPDALARRAARYGTGRGLGSLVGAQGSRPQVVGLKSKDLIGIPWMVAFALRADGWYLRSDIIWAKPNCMPESVEDRPTKSHEYIFLLSKSAKYFYDADAIREPHARLWDASNGGNLGNGLHKRNGNMREQKRDYPMPNDIGRNRRSVWTVATQPFNEAHFAVFPPGLIKPCILAGCVEGGTVLDPFAGSGTSGLVALRHNRNFVGIELNPEYCAMARRRIWMDAPLLNIEGAA